MTRSGKNTHKSVDKPMTFNGLCPGPLNQEMNPDTQERETKGGFDLEKGAKTPRVRAKSSGGRKRRSRKEKGG